MKTSETIHEEDGIRQGQRIESLEICSIFDLRIHYKTQPLKRAPGLSPSPSYNLCISIQIPLSKRLNPHHNRKLTNLQLFLTNYNSNLN
jgi:hypothetical protein